MDPILDLRKNKDTDKGKVLEVGTKAEKHPSQPIKSRRIAWLVPEQYHDYNKSRVIAVGLSILAIATALIFIWGEYLFGIFIALIAILAFIFIKRNVGINNVIIERRGIYINDDYYSYKDLRSFWITYDSAGIKELAIETKSWYVPIIHVPIFDVAPMAIRESLIKYLPERRHDISLISTLMKKMGL